MSCCWCQIKSEDHQIIFDSSSGDNKSMHTIQWQFITLVLRYFCLNQSDQEPTLASWELQCVEISSSRQLTPLSVYIQLAQAPPLLHPSSPTHSDTAVQSRSVAGFNPPRLSLHPGPPSPSPRTGDFNPATKAQDYRISPSLVHHDQRSNISARWTRWTRWRCRLVYANQAFWRRSSLKGGDVITSLWC